MVPHNSDSDGHLATVSSPAGVPRCAFRPLTDAICCPIGEVGLRTGRIEWRIEWCHACHRTGGCAPRERTVAIARLREFPTLAECHAGTGLLRRCAPCNDNSG